MIYKVTQQKPQANFNPFTILKIKSHRLSEYSLSLKRREQGGFLAFEKNFELPSLVAVFDDCNKDYACSKVTHNKNALAQAFAKLLLKLFSHLKIDLNYLLLNIYRDGRKGIGWHADNKKNLVIKLTLLCLV